MNDHQQDWEKIKQELKNLKSIIDEFGINENNWEEVRSNFVSIWNEERLKNMTLEEYTDTQREYSFTYWIETVLIGLGSIKGSSSIKFGIYKKSGDKLNDFDTDGEYTWKKSLTRDIFLWRKNYEEKENIYKSDNEVSLWLNDKNNNLKYLVFDIVKQSLIRTIKSSQLGELNKIDENKILSDIFKWKLAFLYNGKNILNEKNTNALINNIIPIFSLNKLKEIATKKGVIINESNEYMYEYLYTELLKFKNINEDVYQLHIRLFKEYNSDYKIAVLKIDDNKRNIALNMYYDDLSSGTSYFLWNFNNSSNIKEGDKVFFVNSNDNIEVKEFSILETKLVSNDDFILIEVNNDFDGYELKNEIDDNETFGFKIKKSELKNINNKSIKQEELSSLLKDKFFLFEIEKKLGNEINLDKIKKLNLDGLSVINNVNSIIYKDLINIFNEKDSFDSDNFIQVGDIDIKLNGIYIWGRYFDKNKLNSDFNTIKILLGNSKIDSDFADYLTKYENTSHEIQIYKILEYIFNEEITIFIEKIKSKYEIKDSILYNIMKFIGKYDKQGVVYDKQGVVYDKQSIIRYGIEIDNLDEIIVNFLNSKLELSYINFLKNLPNFDYIYVYNTKIQLLNLINQYLSNKDKKEGYTIGLLGKWGEGKSLVIESLKQDFKNYKIYEIDIWKGYSSINSLGNDKIGVIKYMFQEILNQNINFNPFKKYKKTKILNNLYNDIYVGNFYFIGVTTIIISLIISIYSVFIKGFFDNIYLSIIDYIINNLNNLGLLDIIKNYPNIAVNFFKSLILFLLVAFIYKFVITIFKNSFVSKIYDKQISDLNLANNTSKDINKNFLKEKKNIIIIENLDRLNPDQIIDILDLSKTILEFDNTVYIFPIDQYLISEGLKLKYKDFGIQNPIVYIDKIINFPIFIINPFIKDFSKNFNYKVDVIGRNIHNLEIDNFIKKKNDIKKKYFDDSFIRKHICNYNPRKEIILNGENGILEIYSDIYIRGLSYYSKGTGNETYQKLFLFFILIRYVNFNLFSEFDNNPKFFKEFLKIIKDDNSDDNNFFYGKEVIIEKEYLKSEVIELLKDSYFILKELFFNFYKKENIDMLLLLSDDEVKQYMRRVYVPLSNDTKNKLSDYNSILDIN